MKLSITTQSMGVESPATGPEIEFSKGMKMEYGRTDECEHKEDEQQIQGSTQTKSKQVVPPHQLCLTPTKQVNTHTRRGSNTLGWTIDGQLD